MLLSALDLSPDRLLEDYLRVRRGGTMQQLVEAARALHADRGDLAPTPPTDEPGALRVALLAEANGQVASFDGDWTTAVEGLRRAGAMFREGGDEAEAYAADMLVLTTRAANPTVAIDDLVAITTAMSTLLDQLVDISASRQIMLDVRLGYATALLRRNQLSAAAEECDAAAPLAVTDADRARVLGVEALIASGRGDDAAATSAAYKALAAAQAAHDGVQEGFLQLFLAGQVAADGEFGIANDLVVDAIERAPLAGRPFELGALRLRCSLRVIGGDADGAQEDIQRAADLAIAPDEVASVVSGLLAVSTMLLSTEAYGEVIDLLERNDALLSDIDNETAVDIGKARFAAYSGLDRTAESAAALRDTAEVMTRTHHHEAAAAWQVAAQLFEALGDDASAQRARDEAARLKPGE